MKTRTFILAAIVCALALGTGAGLATKSEPICETSRPMHLGVLAKNGDAFLKKADLQRKSPAPDLKKEPRPHRLFLATSGRKNR